MIPYSVSYHELLKYPPFAKALEDNNSEEINNIYYLAGIDTSLPFELRECLHRVVGTNTPWFGFRVEGMERVDQVWKESGIASLEAQTFTTDTSLRDELRSLDPRAPEMDWEKEVVVENVDLTLLDSMDEYFVEDDFYDDEEYDEEERDDRIAS